MVRLLGEIRYYYRCSWPVLPRLGCANLISNLISVKMLSPKFEKSFCNPSFFFFFYGGRGGGGGGKIVMIVTFNKQMGSFLVMKTSEISKWHNKKKIEKTRNNINTPHKRTNNGFCNTKRHPKKSRFLLLTVVAVLLVVLFLRPYCIRVTRPLKITWAKGLMYHWHRVKVPQRFHVIGFFPSILTLPGDEDVFTGLGEIFPFRFCVPGPLVVRGYNLGSGSGPDEIRIQLVFDCLWKFKTSFGLDLENLRHHHQCS